LNDAEKQQLIRRAYEAFNARDVDAALQLMHADVDWPNGMEGGREHGRRAVRDYWTRQFTMIDSHVVPERVEVGDDGRVTVDVHQVVRDLDGNIVSDGHVQHVYTFEDGLIAHMEIVPTT